MKKKKNNKCYNINKKILGCFKCHKILNENFKKINKKNIKKNYKILKNFKLKLKYNMNMNNLTKNLKNNYIIEICKFIKNLYKITKDLKINLI